MPRPHRGMGIYADYAPVYGEAGVRTFPVSIDENGKRPAVRGYLKAGDAQRRAWAESSAFAACDALGIDLRRSGITVLDIDEPDENLLADTLALHGESPFLVRTQSGCFQAYYANSGEPRDTSKTRWNGRKIDLLGGGFTVAPPSRGYLGGYEIIVGDIEDLGDLPGIQNLPTPTSDAQSKRKGRATVESGRRNKTLVMFAMQAAKACESEPELLDKARSFAADSFDQPLPEAEIVRTVGSAWGYTIRGENYAGAPHTRLLNMDIDALVDTPDALLLYTILKRNNALRDEFYIANAMANTAVPYNVKRLSKARRLLVERGYVEKLRPASSVCGPAR